MPAQYFFILVGLVLRLERRDIQALRSHRCDVAFISDNLSDAPLTGFHALREVGHSFPKARSVMLLKFEIESPRFGD